MSEMIPPEELAKIDALVGTTGKDMAIGAYDAAARTEKQIAGWRPSRQSADMDLLPDKDLIDARARDAGRNDAYVKGGADVHKDSVVGSFYMLNSKPIWEVLGKDEDWAEAFQQEVEQKFTLWAESPQKWVDASRENDFTSLIRLSVGVYVFAGETLATVEFPKQKGREFRTAIQMVDTDRLCNPPSAEFSRNIRGGIERDAYGAAMNYYIKATHPSDWRSNARINDMNRWRKVASKKPWGRPQVIYLREQQRIDQSRGVSEMVAGLREIAITRKFRDVTLQKAVLAATYAATIESELPANAVYEQLGVGGSGDGYTKAAESFLESLNDYIGASRHMMIDGVKIPHLYPGTKLNMVNAGEANGVGQDFEASLLRYVATSLGISYEELSGDFTKTNYSSARAAMAGTWKFMQSRKRIVADGMANQIFRLWLEEAIQKDVIKTFPAAEADSLYTDGALNMMFDALSNADWIGAARGQIDELKETQAAVLRIKYGLSTHEDELARLGKDWRKTYSQLERERKEREERGIDLYEDNSVNAASGSPREEESDGTGGQDADEK